MTHIYRAIAALLLCLSAIGSILADANLVSNECSIAFGRLPINDSGLPVEIGASGAREVEDKTKWIDHYVKHAKEYRLYDEECLEPWSSTHEWTKTFAENYLGVVFWDVSFGEVSPVCMGFRVSQQQIMTAAHCIGYGMTFRLFGAPETPLRVEPDYDRLIYAGTDTEDWAVLRLIDNSELKYDWSPKVFLRDVIENQSIAIFAISLPAYYSDSAAMRGNWLNYVRFSRANASKIWALSDLQPPLSSEKAISECLYYKAPTYPGMSGSALIAVKRPTKQGDDPTFFVVGMHLRSGVSDPSAICGSYRELNIGIRIPRSVIAAAEEAIDSNRRN